MARSEKLHPPPARCPLNKMSVVHAPLRAARALPQLGIWLEPPPQKAC